MRNYLILRDKAAAFRADPDVVQVLAAARVPELPEPTLGAGESLSDLLSEEIDLNAVGERGYHFERLDQLALEHLFGTR